MDFKKNLSFIPGFRSNVMWKKVIAIIYYVFSIIMLTAGIGMFLMMASVPFVVFAVPKAFKHKDKIAILTLVIGIVFFMAGGSINSTMQNSKGASTTTTAKVADIKVLSPEEKAKAEADAKIKAEADAAEQAKRAAEDKVLADKAAADKIISDKKAAEDKIIADAKAAEDKKIADYKAWVSSQFSSWDGSNTYLVKLIKENMNDPKSFEHVNTTYADKGDYILVKMVYRGKNAFGGLILQNVTAKSDYKTNMISVISQND